MCVSYQYLWGTYNIDVTYNTDPQYSMENSGQSSGYILSCFTYFFFFLMFISFNLSYYAKVDKKHVWILFGPHSVLSSLFFGTPQKEWTEGI